MLALSKFACTLFMRWYFMPDLSNLLKTRTMAKFSSSEKDEKT